MRVTVFLSSSVPARRLAARDGGDGGGDGEDGGGEEGAAGAGRREDKAAASGPGLGKRGQAVCFQSRDVTSRSLSCP